MFRHLFVLITAAIVSVSSVNAGDRKDLFSDFESASVFEEAGDGQASNTSSRTRIVTVESLRDELKKSGFDAKVATGRAVSARKELAPWTFPVLAEISEDESRIKIVLGLATITDAKKELPIAKMLQLMKASDENDAMFAYSSDRQRIEVAMWLPNRGLNAESLRNEINRLAVLAKKTSEMWSTPSSTIAQTNAASPMNVASTNSLLGKWSAARSNSEAFGIEFLTENKFNLVYIKDGTTTRSSGSFSQSNGSLILKGANNFRLEGKLTMKSDNTFSFGPSNGTLLSFTKATK